MASGQATEDRRDPRLRPTITAIGVVLMVALLVVAAVTKVWALAIALGALLLVVAAGAAVMAVVARRASRDDPAVQAVPDSEREAMPEIFMTGAAGESHGDGGDDTALGDTAEAHDEINPHDLPMDHPGREAAAEQAKQDGTTKGDSEGGQAAWSRGEGSGS